MSELCFLYGIQMLDAGPLPIKSRPLMQPWNLTLLTWLPEQVWWSYSKSQRLDVGADTVLSSNRAICGIVNCSTKGFRKAHRISDPFNVLTLSRGEALQVYLLIIPRFGLLCCCDKPSLSVSVHGGSVNIFHSEMLGTTSGLIRCFATETS